MIFPFLFFIAVLTCPSFIRTMEQPPHRISERIVSAVKKGELDRLKDIHRNNPTIPFAAIQSDGAPLIHIAAATPHVSVMRYLITDVGLNAKAPFHGQTILHTAAAEGNVPMSRYLIEDNILDKNITDLRGRTPLDIAKTNDKFALINYLVPAALNPNVALAQHHKERSKKQILSEFLTEHKHITPCAICYEKKHFKEFTVLKCEHSYCTDCLTQLADHAVSSGNITALRCPTCKNPFETEDTNLLLPDIQMKEKLNLVQFQAWIAQQPNRWACPTPNCPFIFINERTDQFTMQCPSCNFKYCTKCNKEHAADLSCARAEENKKVIIDKEEQEKATERWKAENTRPCPQCKSAIEKTAGCNHMNCHKCKHQFCWQCMNPWQARGHGPFGCSLAAPIPAAANAEHEPQEKVFPSNAHLFFIRDPIGFRDVWLNDELNHAEFFERYKRLSCQKQDEWGARVTQRIENQSSPFLLRSRVWLDALEIVEGHRSDLPDDESVDENELNLVPLHMRHLLAVLSVLHGHNFGARQNDTP